MLLIIDVALVKLDVFKLSQIHIPIAVMVVAIGVMGLSALMFIHSRIGPGWTLIDALRLPHLFYMVVPTLLFLGLSDLCPPELRLEVPGMSHDLQEASLILAVVWPIFGLVFLCVYSRRHPRPSGG